MVLRVVLLANLTLMRLISPQRLKCPAMTNHTSPITTTNNNNDIILICMTDGNKGRLAFWDLEAFESIGQEWGIRIPLLGGDRNN